MNYIDINTIPYGVRAIAPHLGMIGTTWPAVSCVLTVAAFAGNNLVLEGEPGVAKTMGVGRFAEHFPGGGAVMHCKPDVNSTALLIGQTPDPRVMREEGRLVVRREGHLDKPVIIFDEFSRLTSNMLGSMLPGLNPGERLWADEIRPACDTCLAIDPDTAGCHHLPWQMGVACVNFLHVDNVTKATWDRFLLYVKMPDLTEDEKVTLFLNGGKVMNYAVDPSQVFEQDDIDGARVAVNEVALDADLARCILRAFGGTWTGRRINGAQGALRMAAFLRHANHNGVGFSAPNKAKVLPEDLWMLPYLVTPGTVVDMSAIDSAIGSYREAVMAAGEVTQVENFRRVFRTPFPAALTNNTEREIKRFVTECKTLRAKFKQARESLANTGFSTDTANALKAEAITEARDAEKRLQEYQNSGLDAL